MGFGLQRVATIPAAASALPLGEGWGEGFPWHRKWKRGVEATPLSNTLVLRRSEAVEIGVEVLIHVLSL